jgi:hypothetical protein
VEGGGRESILRTLLRDSIDLEVAQIPHATDLTNESFRGKHPQLCPDKEGVGLTLQGPHDRFSAVDGFEDLELGQKSADKKVTKIRILVGNNEGR